MYVKHKYKKGKSNRRLDKSRITLRKGETQRKDGIYDYRWTSPDGKRHSIYASTLEELRAKEEQNFVQKLMLKKCYFIL